MTTDRWYAAHAVLWVRFKDGRQDAYPVWENVYLVHAASHDDARVKGARYATADEGDHSGSFVWDDLPAEWVFQGIRKTVLCAEPDSAPVDGVD